MLNNFLCSRRTRRIDMGGHSRFLSRNQELSPGCRTASTHELGESASSARGPSTLNSCPARPASFRRCRSFARDDFHAEPGLQERTGSAEARAIGTDVFRGRTARARGDRQRGRRTRFRLGADDAAPLANRSSARDIWSPEYPAARRICPRPRWSHRPPPEITHER